MRVSIIRHKKSEKLPAADFQAPNVAHRYINGKAGHQLALLNGLHDVLGKISTSEDKDPDLKAVAFADAMQGLLDLAELQGVNWDQVANEMSNRAAVWGTYSSGVVRIIDGVDD